jgi:hypothetical protein
MFIGREAELQFLENRYKAEGGQLVVLYGRRRVGKTETLRQFCKGKPHVFFACRECTDRLQLKSFSEKMMREEIPAKQYMDQFGDWEKAFRAVLDLPYNDKKKLLVIDEFPYMCKDNPGIPSILQNLWDEIFKDANVMLILCGSAMSFMEKEILAEKNPLYGRATGIYKMTEMGFYDAIKFFPEYSEREKILLYAVLGGIPHYLRQFDRRLSLADNIKENILTKGCALYSEVNFLLRQELRETALYNSLIEAVALGNTRLNDISQKALVDDTSKTSVYLRNLMEIGIIAREFSIDAGTKERANLSRGIYRLTDNFFRFWYAFVFTNYSDLEAGDVEGVYKYEVEPLLHEFGALAFEDVCRQYVQKLQRENALPFRYAKMGGWFGKTTVRDTTKETGLRIAETEIDLVAVSQQMKEYLIGECKFKGRPFGYQEYLDTRAKLTPEKERGKFFYALFSESGFDERIRDLAEQDETLYLYALEDIVNSRLHPDR